MRILKPEEIASSLDFRNYTAEEIAEAYRLGREAFANADVQEFDELNAGVPMEQVLTELAELHKKVTQGRS